MTVATSSEPAQSYNSSCSKLKNYGAAMLIASNNAITASHNNSDDKWIDYAVSLTKFFLKKKPSPQSINLFHH